MDRKLIPTRVETRPLCGCGLSRTFPFCDSSQMISKTYEPGKLVACGAGKQVGRAQPEVESLEG